MIFYSQLGEDLFVYRNFINEHVSDGVFVELGALDGITYSNTKFFEDYLSFSGVLIEPCKKPFKNLLKNRPKSECVNCAISENYENVEFLGSGATAGITQLMSEDHITRWHKRSETYHVQTKPIGDVLNDNNIKYIDFFSIDVEGGEYTVLKSMNWNIKVYLFCIELDGKNTEKDEMCRDILKDNGYTFHSKLLINEFWVNNTYFRKNLLFNDKKEKYSTICDHGTFKYLEQKQIQFIDDDFMKYDRNTQ